MTGGKPHPYPIHTNHELELMVPGHGPLAAFAQDRARDSASCNLGTRPEDGSTAEVGYHFGAPMGEEWRVPAC